MYTLDPLINYILKVSKLQRNFLVHYRSSLSLLCRTKETTCCNNKFYSEKTSIWKRAKLYLPMFCVELRLNWLLWTSKKSEYSYQLNRLFNDDTLHCTMQKKDYHIIDILVPFFSDNSLGWQKPGRGLLKETSFSNSQVVDKFGSKRSWLELRMDLYRLQDKSYKKLSRKGSSWVGLQRNSRPLGKKNISYIICMMIWRHLKTTQF